MVVQPYSFMTVLENFIKRSILLTTSIAGFFDDFVAAKFRRSLAGSISARRGVNVKAAWKIVSNDERTSREHKRSCDGWRQMMSVRGSDEN